MKNKNATGEEKILFETQEGKFQIREMHLPTGTVMGGIFRKSSLGWIFVTAENSLRNAIKSLWEIGEISNKEFFTMILGM